MYRNVSTYKVFCHTHNDRHSLILLQAVHTIYSGVRTVYTGHGPLCVLLPLSYVSSHHIDLAALTKIFTHLQVFAEFSRSTFIHLRYNNYAETLANERCNQSVVPSFGYPPWPCGGR